MILLKERAAEASSSGGPLKASHSGKTDGSKPTTPPARNQAAIAAATKDLQIEAAVEAAHIASISARHFCENVAIGDIAVAEHNLSVAITHLREATAQFRAWQGKPLSREASQ
jgi:hypothetical protein